MPETPSMVTSIGMPYSIQVTITPDPVGQETEHVVETITIQNIPAPQTRKVNPHKKESTDTGQKGREDADESELRSQTRLINEEPSKSEICENETKITTNGTSKDDEKVKEMHETKEIKFNSEKICDKKMAKILSAQLLCFGILAAVLCGIVMLVEQFEDRTG